MNSTEAKCQGAVYRVAVLSEVSEFEQVQRSELYSCIIKDHLTLQVRNPRWFCMMIYQSWSGQNIWMVILIRSESLHLKRQLYSSLFISIYNIQLAW